MAAKSRAENRVVALSCGLQPMMRPKFVVGVCTISLILATMLLQPRPLLLWNLSASAPTGLYLVETRAPIHKGDMVAAFAPAAMRELASQRGYLPASVPLVKRIAGTRGDKVCASGRWLRINGNNAAMRLRTDGRGRRLPWWSGCRRLRGGEALLLNDGAQSFDGRYFGPVDAKAVLGRLVFLWAV
jgi:conjugative transfer signal peptidase TraF